jgi:hypothetical protein
VHLGVRNGLEEVRQQLQALPLPVNQPEDDQLPLELRQRLAERLAEVADSGLVARPGVDDEGALGLALDQVHELDPSLALVEVDELAARLGLIRLEDVRDRRVRLDEERCPLRATQEVDDRHR